MRGLLSPLYVQGVNAPRRGSNAWGLLNVGTGGRGDDMDQAVQRTREMWQDREVQNLLGTPGPPDKPDVSAVNPDPSFSDVASYAGNAIGTVTAPAGMVTGLMGHLAMSQEMNQPVPKDISLSNLAEEVAKQELGLEAPGLSGLAGPGGPSAAGIANSGAAEQPPAAHSGRGGGMGSANQGVGGPGEASMGGSEGVSGSAADTPF